MRTTRLSVKLDVHEDVDSEVGADMLCEAWGISARHEREGVRWVVAQKQINVLKDELAAARGAGTEAALSIRQLKTQLRKACDIVTQLEQQRSDAVAANAAAQARIHELERQLREKLDLHNDPRTRESAGAIRALLMFAGDDPATTGSRMPP